MTHPIDWPTVGPKLLEALEELVFLQPRYDRDKWPVLADAYDAARAAIAAAKVEDRT